MNVLLAHPTGNAFVRAAVRSLHAAGWLQAFFTTLAPSQSLLRWASPALRRQALRRTYPDISADRIVTHGARELLRLSAASLGLSRLTRPGAPASVEAVYASLDNFVAGELASRRPETVYAYEDGADQTFSRARQLGIQTVYELPIAYWETTRRLLGEEAERLPAWRATLGGLDDSPAKLERKTRELQLAHTVIVPSRFVLESLPPAVRAAKRCVVAPFGSPEPVADESRRERSDRPLRVLFAGSLSQRKGLADLFAAMRLLKRSDIELVVMGSALAPLSFYRDEFADFIYEPPRPHGAVLELMRSCDILALPAIVEGRALVQQEALAQGLPLLVTPNAGADDLIDEGLTGFLVAPRDPEAIAGRLAWFADNRAALPAMRRHATARARATGWQAYEAAVLEAVGAA